MASALTITDAAAGRIEHLLSKRETPSAGVRVGVKKGGCSGLSYVIEYADDIAKWDETVNYPIGASDDEAKFQVVIDSKAVLYLIGSEMDFVEEKMKSGFVFKNPNQKSECGCGESFNV